MENTSIGFFRCGFNLEFQKWQKRLMFAFWCMLHFFLADKIRRDDEIKNKFSLVPARRQQPNIFYVKDFPCFKDSFRQCWTTSALGCFAV